MAPKMIGKALGFSVFLMWILRFRKTPQTIGIMSVRSTSKRNIRNPYKTCGILILLEPFWENGTQNMLKGIRICSISRTGFRHVGKPHKTNRKLTILGSTFTPWGHPPPGQALGLPARWPARPAEADNSVFFFLC